MKRPAQDAPDDALRPPRSVSDVNLGDQTFRIVTAAFGVCIVLVLAGMALGMAYQSLPALRTFGLGFLASTEWNPARGQLGALAFIFGTVVSSVLALELALPIALGVAIFLSDLAPAWLRRPLGFVVELLAAIPSVVYGLWGVFVLAPWMQGTVAPALASALGFLPFFR